MAPEAHIAHEAEIDAATDSLLLIWQNPESRKFHRVGRLSLREDGGYSFSYWDGALEIDGFSKLVQFPETEEANEFDVLPQFFENRVLTSDRENYNDYLRWIGLDDASSNFPMEFMALTGGSRATDTFHLVQEPPINPGLYSRFFASSLRHLDPDGELIDKLAEGELMSLAEDVEHDRVPPAMLLIAESGEKIGHLPEWLVDEVHELLREDHELCLRIEKLNPKAPYHLRLLGRIEIVRA